MFASWPKYAGEEPRYDQVKEEASDIGLRDLMFDPDRQAGLPILHFQLVCASCGVLLKLRVQGTRNDRCCLTMVAASGMLTNM